jgi:anti-sigma factor RsiW
MTPETALAARPRRVVNRKRPTAVQITAQKNAAAVFVLRLHRVSMISLSLASQTTQTDAQAFSAGASETARTAQVTTEHIRFRSSGRTSLEAAPVIVNGGAFLIAIMIVRGLNVLHAQQATRSPIRFR